MSRCPGRWVHPAGGEHVAVFDTAPGIGRLELVGCPVGLTLAQHGHGAIVDRDDAGPPALGAVDALARDHGGRAGDGDPLGVQAELTRSGLPGELTTMGNSSSLRRSRDPDRSAASRHDRRGLPRRNRAVSRAGSLRGGSNTPSPMSYHPGGVGVGQPTVASYRGRRTPGGWMRAVLGLAALGLRARWRGWVVLVVLVAIAGGAVLTAVAGARRTASAYPRFLQASKASDVLVSPDGTGVGGYYRALARLPGVAAVAPYVGLQMRVRGQVVAPVDGRFERLVDMPKVLAGRCRGRIVPMRSHSTNAGRPSCVCESAEP